MGSLPTIKSLSENSAKVGQRAWEEVLGKICIHSCEENYPTQAIKEQHQEELAKETYQVSYQKSTVSIKQLRYHTNVYCPQKPHFDIGSRCYSRGYGSSCGNSRKEISCEAWWLSCNQSTPWQREPDICRTQTRILPTCLQEADRERSCVRIPWASVSLIN